MIAVATDNGSLLIYSVSADNCQLVWCAELSDDQTISLQRGNFIGLAGGLVSLTATGKVTVGFLGSIIISSYKLFLKFCETIFNK